MERTKKLKMMSLMKIKITKEIGDQPQKVFGRLQNYCDKKLKIEVLENKEPTIIWNKKERKGIFHEHGIQGIIEVSEDQPCRVTIMMELPLLLFPFQSVIKKSIQDHLDQFWK